MNIWMFWGEIYCLSPLFAYQSEDMNRHVHPGVPAARRVSKKDFCDI